MAIDKWTREQTIVVLSAYFNVPFSKANNSNLEVQKTAIIIGRSINSVKMKIGNFGSLDPELAKRGIVGLKGTSNLDEEIWNEYSTNKEKLAYTSTALIAKFSKKSINQILKDEEKNLPVGLEAIRSIKVRVNQNYFRKNILGIYDNKCCITSLAIPQLLVASHIKPWVTDIKNRMNPENGLCLNSLHDRAFDTGYITISKKYEVKLSKAIDNFEQSEISIKFFKDYSGVKINMPERYYPSIDFLEYHHKNIFIK